MTGIYLFSDQNSTSFIHFNYFRQAYFRTFLTDFYQNLWKHGHVSRRNRYRNDAIKDTDTLNSESWCWITHVAPLESWLSKVALNRWYNDIFRPTDWFQMLWWPLGHGWWILDVELDGQVSLCIVFSVAVHWSRLISREQVHESLLCSKPVCSIVATLALMHTTHLKSDKK